MSPTFCDHCGMYDCYVYRNRANHSLIMISVDTLNTLARGSHKAAICQTINCIKFSTILDVSQSYNVSKHSTIHCWNLSLIDCYRNLKISHFSCHALFSVFSTILWYFFYFHLRIGSLLYGFFRQGLKCEGEEIVEWIFFWSNECVSLWKK